MRCSLDTNAADPSHPELTRATTVHEMTNPLKSSVHKNVSTRAHVGISVYAFGLSHATPQAC
eukprot:16953-Heterococcus_DN1.PRE.2